MIKILLISLEMYTKHYIKNKIIVEINYMYVYIILRKEYLKKSNHPSYDRLWTRVMIKSSSIYNLLSKHMKKMM